METEQLKPANGGHKKKNPMSPEEILHQRKRLNDVSENEKKEAMEEQARYITSRILKLGFNFHRGPFSKDEMDGDAVDVISWDCVCAIFYGER